MEFQPFSFDAQSVMDDWASAQLTASGLPRSDNGCPSEQWEQVGRILAKCVMDGIPLTLQFHPVVYEYLLCGNVRSKDLLPYLDPDDARVLRDVLLCQFGGTPRCVAYLGDVQVTDATKRGIVRAHAHRLLFGGGCEEHLQALHHGFVSAFDWSASLRLLARHTDNASVLFMRPGALRADRIRLDLVDADHAVAGRHRDWLRALLEQCPPPVLQQFVVRVTGRMAFESEGPGHDLTVLVACTADDDGQQHVRFVADSRMIVLPVCADESTLQRLVRRHLNMAVSTECECPNCGDVYAPHDGLTCPATAAHFICHTCFEELVKSECATSPATLCGTQRRGRIVCCPACPNNETEFEEMAVVLRVSNAVRADYRAVQQAITETLVSQRLDKEYGTRLESELARLEQMSEGERKVRRHRIHIAENILTVKCPGCGWAFVDWTQCDALTCDARDERTNTQYGCGVFFCAVCQHQSPTGGENHAHVRSAHGTYFGPAENVAERWRQRHVAKLREYFGRGELASDPEMRRLVLAACTTELGLHNIQIRDLS
jgi:hypothetical protein